MKNTINLIARILVTILLLIIVGAAWANKLSETEIETYTIGMEVIEKDFSSYYSKIDEHNTTYIMNLRGSGHATILEVNEQTYASYSKGEILEVEVRIMENLFENWTEYKILGLQK